MRGTAIKDFSFCEFKSHGKTIRGSLHLPRAKGGTWVIFSHGFTGHRIGPGYLYVGISRALAGGGTPSLRFDFAGSGESDGNFSDMNCTTMQADLAAAISFVKRRYAPERIVLFGHSLGGCVAALCSGIDKVAGLALLAPVADPMAMVNRRQELIRRGVNAEGYYENGPFKMSIGFLDALREIHPVSEMERSFQGRLLLIQGDADPSISVDESASYVQAAQRAGIDSRYHVLKGSDHNFSSVSGHHFICSTVTAWIKEFAS